MNENGRLKKMLDGPELIMAPGAYDAMTAKLVEAAGFPVVYMTGYGTSAARFGYPDLGLVTMTEMVDNAALMAESVSIPLIADADTGYGNPINVARTVSAYERAGAAAIHIEDQVWPKRCGHMKGKQVIPAEEMAAKIRSAVDTRRSDGFLIIARTDALAVEGFEAAVERAALYAEAGADLLFVEAPTSQEALAEIPKRLPQKPHLVNLAPLTPNLPADELAAMGFKLAIYPGICLAAVVTALQTELARLKDSGRQRDLSDWVGSFVEMNRFLGAEGWEALEKKYTSL